MTSYPFALGTLLTKLSFVTRYTDDVMSTWYEAARTDQLMADLAAEALGVPLATLVFILLHTYINRTMHKSISKILQPSLTQS